MKLIDVIEEQLFSKMKEKLANAGQKIQGAVNNLTNKQGSTERPLPGRTPAPQGKSLSQEYQEFIKKYESINSDKTNMKALVYVKTYHEQTADNELDFQAQKIFGAKLYGPMKPGETRSYQMKGSFIPVDNISYSTVDENGKTVYYFAKVIEYTPSSK